MSFIEVLIQAKISGSRFSAELCQGLFLFCELLYYLAGRKGAKDEVPNSKGCENANEKSPEGVPERGVSFLVCLANHADLNQQRESS